MQELTAIGDRRLANPPGSQHIAADYPTATVEYPTRPVADTLIPPPP
jgi:hypothetical protein